MGQSAPHDGTAIGPLRAAMASLINLRLRRAHTDERHDLVERYSAAVGVDTVLSSAIAQFHTFAIPKISALLHQTRQYEDDGPRRLDDTKGLMGAALGAGPDAPDGQAAIAQINRIHSQYRIDNDEYLYVLSTFAFGSQHWTDNYAWRAATRDEEVVLYRRLVDVGRAMGIHDVPDDAEELRTWVDDYLVANRRYHPDNHAVAEGLMRAAESLVPAPIRPFVSPTMRVWIGEPELLAALGYQAPPAAYVGLVTTAMKLRRGFCRRFTAMNGRTFTELFLATSLATRPDGFTSFSELGPPALLAKFARQDAETNVEPTE